ncbi:MAG TPA: isoprenyl transferase [Caldithrix abyssi]|uniref:Isoprenyl transferase n=1 Tax=Caldithrix abyssi TaxID=187145 RepID=A0A7V5RQ45_CALAY|nr:isoprenyl transferase [Caldithrix abyssi]
MNDFYSLRLEEKIEQLKERDDLPRHVGIIMDGNGRWAKAKGLPRVAGHNVGVHSVEDVVEGCAEIGINNLTIYTFSEENWKRPSREVAALMQLLVSTINRKLKKLVKQNVQIRTIGHLNKLPSNAQRTMMSAIQKTKRNTGLILNVALSYGGRQELIDAFRKLAHLVSSGEISPDEINDQLISNELDTKGQPDPDLIIRTGGENRISNFLLWQIAYSEIYVTPTPWPEFRKSQLADALWSFLQRERRYGMISEQIKGQATVPQI